jgi:hypothetical protein
VAHICLKYHKMGAPCLAFETWVHVDARFLLAALQFASLIVTK